MAGYGEGYIFKPLTFGVDFDDTITADPQTLLKVIAVLREAGHMVYITTYRGEFEKEPVEKFRDKVNGIVYTARRNKEEACKDAGVHVDIWMDDEPRTITHDMHMGTFVPPPKKPGIVTR